MPTDGGLPILRDLSAAVDYFAVLAPLALVAAFFVWFLVDRFNRKD